MPNATVSQELHHFELKSLKGAFVELRQLPYADMLTRRDKGSVTSMEQKIDRKTRSREDKVKMTVEVLQSWEKNYMFKSCIANHNLEDANGVSLDFNNPMTLKTLRPDIGYEIERLIDDLHSEGDDFSEDFPNVASTSSEQPKPELLTLANTDTPTN